MSDVLCLCKKVERTMLDILEDVRLSVRTVEVDISLLLVNEGLVTHRLEVLPDGYKALYHTDVGTSLDVEVTCIEETADVEARDELERLERSIGGRTL